MSRRTVLVVDDEPAVRKLVCRMLETDYNVIEAEDGSEAITMTCSHRPDIVFMDMMMPEVNGLSACYAIKDNEATRAIPVVMLTAISHQLNRKLSQSVVGADGYITKPFTRESLLSEVRRLIPSEGDDPGSVADGEDGQEGMPYTPACQGGAHQ